MKLKRALALVIAGSTWMTALCPIQPEQSSAVIFFVIPRSLVMKILRTLHIFKPVLNLISCST
jgi:hypothetical protein